MFFPPIPFINPMYICPSHLLVLLFSTCPIWEPHFLRVTVYLSDFLCLFWLSDSSVPSHCICYSNLVLAHYIFVCFAFHSPIYAPTHLLFALFSSLSLTMHFHPPHYLSIFFCPSSTHELPSRYLDPSIVSVIHYTSISLPYFWSTKLNKYCL